VAGVGDQLDGLYPCVWHVRSLDGHVGEDRTICSASDLERWCRGQRDEGMNRGDQAWSYPLSLPGAVSSPEVSAPPSLVKSSRRPRTPRIPSPFVEAPRVRHGAAGPCRRRQWRRADRGGNRLGSWSRRS
jgi:hypothetical protein